MGPGFPLTRSFQYYFSFLCEFGFSNLELEAFSDWAGFSNQHFLALRLSVIGPFDESLCHFSDWKFMNFLILRPNWPQATAYTAVGYCKRGSETRLFAVSSDQAAPSAGLDHGCQRIGSSTLKAIFSSFPINFVMATFFKIETICFPSTTANP